MKLEEVQKIRNYINLLAKRNGWLINGYLLVNRNIDDNDSQLFLNSLKQFPQLRNKMSYKKMVVFLMEAILYNMEIDNIVVTENIKFVVKIKEQNNPASNCDWKEVAITILPTNI